MALKSYKSKKQHQQCTEVQTCPTWVSAQPSTLPAPTRHQVVIFELVDDIVFLFTACLSFRPQRYYFFHSWRGRLGKEMCPLLLAAWFGCCFLLLMFLIRTEMAVHLRESHSVISWHSLGFVFISSALVYRHCQSCSLIFPAWIISRLPAHPAVVATSAPVTPPAQIPISTLLLLLLAPVNKIRSLFPSQRHLLSLGFGFSSYLNHKCKTYFL